MRLANPKGITISDGDYCARTVYWLSAGRVVRNASSAPTIKWSQPEIVLYARDQTPADPNLFVSAACKELSTFSICRGAFRLSNLGSVTFADPDIIQQAGDIFIAETDKQVMRTHHVERTLVEGLLRQNTISEVVRDSSLVLERNASGSFAVPPALWADPIAGSNASFTIELTGVMRPSPVAVPKSNVTNTSFRLVRKNASPVDFVAAATSAPNLTPWIVPIPDDGTAATGCKGPPPPGAGAPKGNTCVEPQSLMQCAARCAASLTCNYFWYYHEGRCCPKQSYDLKQGWVNFTEPGGWYEMVEDDDGQEPETFATVVLPSAAMLDCRDADRGDGVALFAPQAGPGSGRAQPLLSLASGAGASRKHQVAGADSDSWQVGGSNTVAVVVDGAAQVISFVVNGVLSDGSLERSQGWTSLDQALGSIAGGGRCTADDGVSTVRMYDRALTTTELIGMWRAGAVQRSC